MIKKLFISSIVIIALLFSFSVFASADLLGGGSLLGGALSSVGVDLLAGGSATAAMIAPWLSGDFSILGELTGVANGYIKVNNDSVIIDGVEYQTIFLDPNMAQELHTQVFDFITQKAIGPFGSGILASGTGYVNSIPIFSQNGTLYSQTYFLPETGLASVGNYIVSTDLIEASTTIYQLTVSIDGSTPTSNQQDKSVYSGVGCQVVNISRRPEFKVGFLGSDPSHPSGYNIVKLVQSVAGTLTQSPFDYSYVSGAIDATPLPSNYGFQYLVPTSELTQAGISSGTYIIDGGTGTDAIIEIIEFLDSIFDELKNPEFIEEITPPVPIPTTPLSDVPYDEFIDTFGQSIYDKLDNVSESVDTVGQSITDKLDDVDDTIDTVGQSIIDELEAQTDIFDTIGTAIDNIESAVTDVVDGIQVKVGEIADTLVDIKDGILEAIEEGPIKLIDSGLDVLRSIFGPVLQSIRSHVGIWHYVVSWVQTISTPFTWILSIANGTSYYMVLPLYALIAGTLVIAIYKRFGR